MASFDVFISYSRKDSDFVHELVDFLAGEKREVWVDWQDIPPASEWEQDIYRSIDGAESFVFVASASSLASEYCGRELRHAGERGKRIVPFAIDGAAPHTAPTALSQLNWIRCGGADDREALAALVTALDTDLVWARAHTRLLIRAVDWEERGDSSLLLRGKDLAEAERVLDENAGKEPRPTELQQRYLHASRSAAKKRQRILLGSVSVALAVSIGLAVLAVLQRNTAVRERNSAGSVALASASRLQLTSHPDVSLLLGLEANRLKPSAPAESSMISALQDARAGSAWALIRIGAPVTAIAFSPSGDTLAVGGSDGVARLWDLRTHREFVPPLRGHEGTVFSLAFSRDGKTLAAGVGGRTVQAVQLWDLRTGKLKGKPIRQADSESVTGVGFSRDGTRVASFTPSRLTLWDVRTHTRIGRPFSLAGSNDASGDAEEAVSSDGSTVAVLYGDGKVDLWHVRYDDIARSKPVGLGIRDGNTTNLTTALGADGRTVITKDKDGVFRLTSIGAKSVLGQASVGGGGFLPAAAIGPDGRTIATGGTDETVRLATLTRGPITPQRLGLETLRVAFANDGRALVGGDGALHASRAWTSETPPSTSRLLAGKVAAPVLAQGVHDVAFSRDGRRAVVAGDDAQGDEVAQIFTVRTGRPAVRLAHHSGTAFAAAFSTNGKRIVTGGVDGARLWNAESGASLHRLPPGGDGGSVHAVAFNPAGTLVATGTDGGAVGLWRTDGTHLHTFNETGPISAVAFSPNGNFVAAAGGSVAGGGPASVNIWNVHTYKRQGPPLPGAADGYESDGVAFSPDGRIVATEGGTTGGQGQVQLWDLRTHAAIGTPIPGDSVAFSPDGRSFLVGVRNAGSAVLVRNVLWRDFADLRTRVCNLVWGNLTKTEWATYAPGLPAHKTCG